MEVQETHVHAVQSSTNLSLVVCSGCSAYLGTLEAPGPVTAPSLAFVVTWAKTLEPRACPGCRAEIVHGRTMF